MGEHVIFQLICMKAYRSHKIINRRQGCETLIIPKRKYCYFTVTAATSNRKPNKEKKLHTDIVVRYYIKMRNGLNITFENTFEK